VAGLLKPPCTGEFLSARRAAGRVDPVQLEICVQVQRLPPPQRGSTQHLSLAAIRKACRCQGVRVYCVWRLARRRLRLQEPVAS
jgi:hypothetical protein